MNTQTKHSWTSIIINAFVIYGASLAGAASDFDDQDLGLVSSNNAMEP